MRIYYWGPESYGEEFSVLAESEEKAKEYIRAWARSYPLGTNGNPYWSRNYYIRSVEEVFTRPCKVFDVGEVLRGEIS